MYPILVVSVFLSLLVDGVFLYTRGTSLNIYPIFVMPIIVLSILYNVRNNHIKLGNQILFFLLFLIAMYMSLIFNDIKSVSTPNIIGNFKSILSYTFWPLIFILTITQKRSEQGFVNIIKLLHFIGYIIALNCLLPIVIYFIFGITLGEFIVYQGQFRSFGFLTDQVGFSLVYFLIYSLGKKRYFSFALFFMAIFVTGTRGAILIAIIGSVYTYIYYIGKKKFSVIVIFRYLIIVGVISFVIYSNLIENILLRVDRNSIENTSNQRLGAMRAGGLLFLKNPIFGVGLGNFADIVYGESDYLNYFNYVSHGVDAKSGFANAQNQFVDIAVNGGVFSLFFVIGFLFYSIKKLKYNIRNSNHKFEYHIIFVYIVLMLIFNQSALYMFNVGINSFIFLLLLGLGSSGFNSADKKITTRIISNQ